MVYVINSLGEQELFSPKKVYNSIIRSGGSKVIAEKVLKEVEKKIYPDISTFELYRLVRKLLEKEKKEISIKFNLKQALKDLGPEGFVFEKFIKEIFEESGYNTQGSQILKGKCVDHEIDFVAQNSKKKYIGECKFRNRIGERIDVNVPMKTFAVLEDINEKNAKGMIVTNEKFTENALRYAKCKGIKLLGWKYPKDAGLEKIIDNNLFYPITILPSFNNKHLNIFVQEDVILIKNLKKKNYSFFKKYNISQRYFNQLIKEASLIN